MEKCDVLYIHSIKNPLEDIGPKYNIMPMGIIGILNDIKNKGHHVIGINYQVEKELDPNFNLKQLLENIEYKVLLTDLHWYVHSFGAIYVAECSKQIKSNIPTVIGGYTSTIFADEIMENFSCIDYVVTGDSDLPLVMLIDYLLDQSNGTVDEIPNILYRHGTDVIRAKKTWVQTTLDNIDFISTDFFKHEEYIPHLTTSSISRKDSRYWLCIARGCKFNCAYCCGANKNMSELFGRCNILIRSPQKVASDFLNLSKRGIRYVAPSHDFQMFGKEYYKSIFAEIRKSNIKPGMYLECFQLPTKDYIDDMLQTFDIKKLILVISPTSGNEELRKKNGKYFSNDALYEIASYLKSKSVAFQLYYTENLVGETEEQFIDTYVQMRYLHVMLGLSIEQIFYQSIVIDPLAGMRDFDGIKVDYHTFKDYYQYCITAKGQSDAPGFETSAEVPYEKKMQMYKSIFQ